MKNHLAFLSRLVLLALWLTSCGPAKLPPTSTPTQSATAVPTLTLTPPPVPSATMLPVLSIATVNYRLPKEIAKGIIIESLPELMSPITDEPVPRHVSLTLTDYSVESQFTGEVNIFSRRDSFRFQKGRQITLGSAIKGKASPQDYIDTIDLFSVNDIKVRPQKVDFQNGSGVSYLYYWGMDGPVPASNDRLVYIFDGLTDDNKYYVQIYLPVKIPFLDDSIDSSQPVSSAPPGVVPYPDYKDYKSVGKYYETLYSKLNDADAKIFSPPLDTLDTFISSLLLVLKE